MSSGFNDSVTPPGCFYITMEVPHGKGTLTDGIFNTYSMYWYVSGTSDHHLYVKGNTIDYNENLYLSGGGKGDSQRMDVRFLV